MWCQPFPFTVNNILISHPEFNRLHLYGNPREIKSEYQNMEEANRYLMNLSSKRSYKYKKLIRVVLTLIDNSQIPFIAYINPQVIMVIMPKIIEYYALQAIESAIKIASNTGVIPFSRIVMADYLDHVNLIDDSIK